MHWTFRLRMATLLVILTALTAGAAASFGVVPFSKGFLAEDFEKDAPGPGLLATLPEDEGSNDDCPGQTVACEDLVAPARIDEPGDRDHYVITVDEGTCLTVGTVADSLQPVADTVIEILDAGCSTVLASDDDNGPGSFSLVTEFRVPAAGSYVIRVRHFLPSGTGGYRLFVKCAEAGATNATCATAAVLECGKSDLAGTTDCTGNEYNPMGPATSCTQFSAAGQDVVYRVDAAPGNGITLTYRSSVDGSIYILRSCASAPDFCVAGADRNGTGVPETLTYTFPDSATYYVVLDSFGNLSSGAWTLTADVDCVTPVEPATWGQIKLRYASRERTR